MNYREQQTTGTAWRRCSEVTLFNPLGGPQFARFTEQDAMSMGDKTAATTAGFIDQPFDVQGVFPLLDPQTGEPTGQSMTHGALYQALFSLYMQCAIQRDAATPE